MMTNRRFWLRRTSHPSLIGGGRAVGAGAPRPIAVIKHKGFYGMSRPTNNVAPLYPPIMSLSLSKHNSAASSSSAVTVCDAPENSVQSNVTLKDNDRKEGISPEQAARNAELERALGYKLTTYEERAVAPLPTAEEEAAIRKNAPPPAPAPKGDNRSAAGRRVNAKKSGKSPAPPRAPKRTGRDSVKSAVKAEAVEAAAKAAGERDAHQEAQREAGARDVAGPGGVIVVPEEEDEEEEQVDQTGYLTTAEVPPGVLPMMSHVETTRIVTSNVAKFKWLLRFMGLREAHIIGRWFRLLTPAFKTLALLLIARLVKTKVVSPMLAPVIPILSAASTATGVGSLFAVRLASGLLSWAPTLVSSAYGALQASNVINDESKGDYFFVDNVHSVTWTWAGDRVEHHEDANTDVRSITASTTTVKRRGGLRIVNVIVLSSRGRSRFRWNVVEELFNELTSADKSRFALSWRDFEIYLDTRLPQLTTAISIPRDLHQAVISNTSLFAKLLWKQRKLELQAQSVVMGLDETTGVDF